MRSKRKRKKSLVIFLIIIIIVSIFAIINYEYGINLLKEEKTNTYNSDNSKEDDPYKEYKKLSYFKKENLNRYLAFKEKNPDYSYEKVVTYVNIGLDYDFYSYISDADTSKGNLLLMNKYYKLTSDYKPDDLEEIDSKYFISGNSDVRKLRKEAKEAFEMLSEQSIKNNTPVYGQSAYRTYDLQDYLYNKAVNSLGIKQADIDTARPGHSEHQTGLAIDVSSTKWGNMLSFDETASFNWMKDNAYKYGFILRYRNDTVDITGFMYESWHYRYVGVDIATDMHDNFPDLTYEEYYVRFLDK